MKRTVNYILLLLLSVAGLLSCDDKIRELEELNSKPVMQYFLRNSTDWENATNDQVIEDTAKIWNNYNNASYPAIVHIFDSNYNLNKVTIKNNNPDISFFVNDFVYNSEYSTTEFPEEYNLAFRNNKVSVEDYKISAIDNFGALNTLTFRIHYKENELPVPQLQIVLKDGAERLYQLYGESSFDKDKKYGGKIVEYEFIIDNIVIRTSQPNIYHIFSVGDHTVRFRVKDNDNIWSNYISNSITVK